MILHTADADLFYEVRGSGPDVVLLHPFPCAHEFWLPLVEALESRFRFILPDLRGLGRSQTGEGPATMARHAADLLGLCDALKLRRVIFGGCSIGGYILFELWRRQPERFRALLLADTKSPADTPSEREARLKMAEAVLERGPQTILDALLSRLLGETTRRNRPDIAAAARALMARNTAQGLSAVQRGMAERPDSTATLRTISVPTMVMGGEEDMLTPRLEMERLANGIPGAELRILLHAGHLAAFEQPEEFLLAVLPWLEAQAKA